MAEGAHRGAAAEMRDDHPLECNVRRDLGERARNIFVGEAVETVAPDPLSMQITRDRIVVRPSVAAAIKGGIKTRDCGISGKRARIDRIAAKPWG
jgi:hypothetical protein